MHSSEGSLLSSFIWFSRMQRERESNSTPLDGVCKPIGLDKAQRLIRASKIPPDRPITADQSGVGCRPTRAVTTEPRLQVRLISTVSLSEVE